MFILFDAAGKARAGFGMTKQGPEIPLTDEKGKPQLKLAAEGPPLLQLFDDGGKLRADLTVRKGGVGEGPAFQLYRRCTVESPAALIASKDGPAFVLFDRSGRVLRSLAGRRPARPARRRGDVEGESGMAEPQEGLQYATKAFCARGTPTAKPSRRPWKVGPGSSNLTAVRILEAYCQARRA